MEPHTTSHQLADAATKVWEDEYKALLWAVVPIFEPIGKVRRPKGLDLTFARAMEVLGEGP